MTGAKTESNNAPTAFLKSTAILAAAMVFSQLCGLLSKSLLGSTFGTSAQVDAYLASNRLTETIFNLVAGGALASAFVPLFSTLLDQHNREEAWRLASNVANLLIAALTVITGILFIFADSIAKNFLVPGFALHDPSVQQLTAQLLRIQLPSVVIFGVSGLLMGILNSNGNFLLPGIAPAMYQIGILIGIVWLSKPFGIRGLAYGALLGSSLHFLAQLPGLIRIRDRKYFPGLGLRNERVREVVRLMVPRQIGASAVQLNFLVNNFIASFLPPGSITAISLGLSLMLMPQAVIAQSVATVSLPRLSVLAGRGALDKMREALAATLRLVLLLSLPAATGLILFSRDVVRLIFERRVFSAHMTQMVQWALVWYCAGLVFHCVVEVVSRAFYAVHDTKTPVIVLFCAMTLNMILSIALTRLFSFFDAFPHGGVALANSIATGLEMAALLILMRRRLDGLDGARLKKALIKSGSATLAMIAYILLWRHFIKNTAPIIFLIGGMGGAVLVYGTACFMLKVEELALLRRFVRRN